MNGVAGVVLLVLATAGGTLVDATIGGTNGMTLAFLAGCVLAALLVHRTALLTVCVAPPLVFAGVLVTQALLNGTTGLRNIGVTVGTELIVQFPVLAAGAGAALVVALVRGLAERPTARHRP